MNSIKAKTRKSDQIGGNLTMIDVVEKDEVTQFAHIPVMTLCKSQGLYESNLGGLTFDTITQAKDYALYYAWKRGFVTRNEAKQDWEGRGM